MEHITVNRFNIEIERWTFLEELGVPDVYVPKLDLIIEVKLLANMWNLKGVKEQSLRYLEISETVIVSLDGEPYDWQTERTVPWFNPIQLFDFLSEFS